jgi:trans-aconitate 2-methyltransferase
VSRDWDATVYERISQPQADWARQVIDRLALTGDERVLDAGCGSGRVTRMLLERLPDGFVVGFDGSPSMVAAARESLDPERTELAVSDLTELTIDEPVDAVFSNAVFHWIPDHPKLFARLFDALRPGGRLVAQCGGARNLDGFHERMDEVIAEEPYSKHLAGWQGPWNFATPAQTAPRLAAAGFVDVDVWLEPRRMTPPEPREFLRVVCLGHHLERLPEPLRDPFVDDVFERAGDPLLLDYSRLNIDARRPA